MTIKEIARLAGVSISTVSKIMNGKDASISTATREKVLTIIKKYHYAPYSTVNSQRGSKTLIIGLLLRSGDAGRLTAGVIMTAQANGYTVMVCDSGGNTETELKSITALCRHNADGILWEPVAPESLDYAGQFREARIPYQVFNASFDEESFDIDYRRAAYTAVEALIRKKHTNIACVPDSRFRTQTFLDGYKKCLFDHQIPCRDHMVFTSIDNSFLHQITRHQISGIVTADYQTALELYETLDRLHFRIPQDVSLVSLRHDGPANSDYPHISVVRIPHGDFGRQLCLNMIHLLEKAEKTTTGNYSRMLLENDDTIDIPYHPSQKRILVVGSVNADCYMKFDEFPVSGKTAIASEFSSYPGGKGVNQAIGAAKLGSQVALIGAVGNDIESTMILSALSDYNVDSRGVYRAADTITGKAYVYLNHSGESLISILAGANQNITPEFVAQQEYLFENISCCLLATEIPANTILAAAKLARRHGVQTILKPSASPTLGDELLTYTDILVPNRAELNTLRPDLDTLEEQAEYYLSKGVNIIIVTLGADGCYLRTGEISRYFAAEDFPAVDHTGAGDAFIAALAVYLQKGYPIVPAVRIAVCAAGFSISREGVVPALIDANTLESYLNRPEPATAT